MNKNIINKYVKLLLIIINNVDPMNKCIEHQLFILINIA